MVNRQCNACLKTKGSEMFSGNQWAKGVDLSRCTSCVANDNPVLEDWERRECYGCGFERPSDAFSNNQWNTKGDRARCKSCVGDDIWDDEDLWTAKRTNDAKEASFNYDFRFAQGSFRNVYLGTYTRGRRTGQKAVAKKLREDRMQGTWAPDVRASNTAIEIVQAFNSHRLVSKPIRVNEPEIWASGAILVEPFIEGYTKFNSNTGWAAAHVGGWNEVMQALSHFSYHWSNGSLLLCDVQGGIYEHHATITDPVILSREGGQYGTTDLGMKGMHTFFSHHKCNRFCSRAWRIIPHAIQFYEPSKHSSTSFDIQPTHKPVAQPRISNHGVGARLANEFSIAEEEEEEFSDDEYQHVVCPHVFVGGFRASGGF